MTHANNTCQTRVLLQDSTYHGLCYTSRGALAGTRNGSMGPPHEGSIRLPIANALTTELILAPTYNKYVMHFNDDALEYNLGILRVGRNAW